MLKIMRRAVVLRPDESDPAEIFLQEARSTKELLDTMRELAGGRDVYLSECAPELRDGVPQGKKVVFLLSLRNWAVGIPDAPHDENGYLQVNAFRTNLAQQSFCIRVIDDLPLKIKAEYHDPFSDAPTGAEASMRPRYQPTKYQM
jgi:hypothetical protein